MRISDLLVHLIHVLLILPLLTQQLLLESFPSFLKSVLLHLCIGFSSHDVWAVSQESGVFLSEFESQTLFPVHCHASYFRIDTWFSQTLSAWCSYAVLAVVLDERSYSAKDCPLGGYLLLESFFEFSLCYLSLLFYVVSVCVREVVPHWHHPLLIFHLFQSLSLLFDFFYILLHSFLLLPVQTLLLLLVLYQLHIDFRESSFLFINLLLPLLQPSFLPLSHLCQVAVQHLPLVGLVLLMFRE